MSFIVAIDGPAGSGKGTITNILANDLKLNNIDTGAMYRCIALEVLNKNIDINDIEKVKEILNNIKIELKETKNKQIVLLNGEDVSDKIRSNEVTSIVSPVSAIYEVRQKLTDLQRKMGKTQNIIMEGRDITTVVFPNADVKIYLDCSEEERANRRYKQNLEKGIECTYEEVLANIKERHKLETQRDIAPLTVAKDARYIDTTHLGLQEVEDLVVSIIREKVEL